METGIAERAILAYSISGPEHPGKWRVVDLLVRLTDLHRRCGGREVIAERQGVRWKLSLDDWVQRTLYLYGEWDALEVAYIRGRLTPGAVFLDIGAHFGYYSLVLARHLKADLTAFAFEPVERNFQRLAANIKLNALSSVHAVNCAIGETAGRVTLELPPDRNQGSGRVRGSADDTPGVAVTTIDAFVEENKLRRVDVMKIDIEGMEVAALRGAVTTIERLRPEIVVELNPTALLEQGESAAALLELLLRHDYSLHEATKHGLVKFDAGRLDSDTALRGGYVNLICRPARSGARRRG